MTEIFLLGRVLLAAILGGILGIQRERWGKFAGGRTYALVAAGAALFTIISLYAFPNSDASRVAAQIVTGIGFLGAGTILHKENRVEGLTTATGLWIAAAIGMAVGVSYFLLAICVTLAALIILMIDENKFGKKKIDDNS